MNPSCNGDRSGRAKRRVKIEKGSQSTRIAVSCSCIKENRRRRKERAEKIYYDGDAGKNRRTVSETKSIILSPLSCCSGSVQCVVSENDDVVPSVERKHRPRSLGRANMTREDVEMTVYRSGIA